MLGHCKTFMSQNKHQGFENDQQLLLKCPQHCKKFNVHGYVDDHQLYMSFAPNNVVDQYQAFTDIETCLRDAKDWMIGSKLKMNDSIRKTEFMIIGSHQQIKKVNFGSR